MLGVPRPAEGDRPVADHPIEGYSRGCDAMSSSDVLQFGNERVELLPRVGAAEPDMSASYGAVGACWAFRLTCDRLGAG